RTGPSRLKKRARRRERQRHRKNSEPMVSPGSARVSRAGFGVSPKQSFDKIREGETPSPTRETRALPGLFARHQIELTHVFITRRRCRSAESGKTGAHFISGVEWRGKNNIGGEAGAFVEETGAFTSFGRDGFAASGCDRATGHPWTTNRCPGLHPST